MDYHSRNCSNNINAISPITATTHSSIKAKTNYICMLNNQQFEQDQNVNSLTPNGPKPDTISPPLDFEDKRPSQVTAVDFSVQSYTPQLLQSMTSDAGSFYRNRNTSSASSMTVTSTSYTFTGVSIGTNCYADDSKTMDITTLQNFEMIREEYDDRSILTKYGYEKIKEIKQTSQGVVIEAIRKKTGETVAIKRCDKILHANHEARNDVIANTPSDITPAISMDGDALHSIVEENIVHEATILRYLTSTDSSALDFMCRFIQFFESDTDYYLVMEYGGNTTLNEFISEAMIYLKDGSLTQKEWKRTIKFLFWQLSVLMVWLHRDMNCCHLDLNPNNIVLDNANFNLNQDTLKMEIDADVNLKLTDFGLSEVFNPDNSRPFDCMKFEVYRENMNLLCPNRYKQRRYDAKKSDVWSLGIILYTMMVGRAPFRHQDREKKDPRYWLLRHKKFPKLLQADHQKSFNLKLVNLFGGLFALKEYERMKMSDIVHHAWFKTYYLNYAEQIIANSQEIEDLQENEAWQKRMKVFPYYKGIDAIEWEY